LADQGRRARPRLCCRRARTADRASRYQPRAAQYRHVETRTSAGGARRRRLRWCRHQSDNPAETWQEAKNIEGLEVLTAFARVAPLGWLMFVELPAEEAYAPLYAALKRLGFVLLAALFIAVLAGMFLAGRMVGPIQALRLGAARLGSGDL